MSFPSRSIRTAAILVGWILVSYGVDRLLVGPAAGTSLWITVPPIYTGYVWLLGAWHRLLSFERNSGGDSGGFLEDRLREGCLFFLLGLAAAMVLPSAELIAQGRISPLPPAAAAYLVYLYYPE